jgi:hypothetical protein
MPESDRLRQLTPELAAVIVESGARATQLAACRQAADAAGFEDRRAVLALETLAKSGPSAPLAKSSQLLADEYDEAAWAAQERGSAAEYLVNFRRARAAAALAYAHRDDPHEAVYEAANAFDDTDRFADALRAALRNGA